MNSESACPLWNTPRKDYVEALVKRGPMRVVLIDIKGDLVNFRFEPGYTVDESGKLKRNHEYFAVIGDNDDKPKAYPVFEWEPIVRRISKERVALGHLNAVRAAIARNKPIAGRVLLDFT
jgi:hypothetical protein